MKEPDHLHNARLQLLHRHLLFCLHRGAHHLPLHHTVFVQSPLVLVKNSLLMALTEILRQRRQKKKLVTKSSVVPWTRQYMMTKMFTCIYVRRVNWKRIFMLLLKKTSLVRHLTHPWGVDAFKREMFGAWSTYRIQPSGIQTCSPLITSLIPLPLGHRLKTWL